METKSSKEDIQAIAQELQRLNDNRTAQAVQTSSNTQARAGKKYAGVKPPSHNRQQNRQQKKLRAVKNSLTSVLFFFWLIVAGIFCAIIARL